MAVGKRRGLQADDVRRVKTQAARWAGHGTILEIVSVVHDGKCRCPAKRLMGNGVLYGQALNLGCWEHGKGMGQGRRNPFVFPRGYAELCGL